MSMLEKLTFFKYCVDFRLLGREFFPDGDLQVVILRIATIVAQLLVRELCRIALALGMESLEFDELAVIKLFEDVCYPVEQDHRLLALDGGIERHSKWRRRACIDDFEVHGKGHDTL